MWTTVAEDVNQCSFAQNSQSGYFSSSLDCFSNYVTIELWFIQGCESSSFKLIQLFFIFILFYFFFNF